MNNDLRKAIIEAVRSEIKEAIAPLQKQAVGWESILESRQSLHDEEIQKQKKGIAAARMVRALTAAKGDPERACHFAKKAWDDKLGKRVVELFEKAVSAGQFDAGGFMIPPEVADEVIELLRPRSVIRAGGAQQVPMPRGTLALPKQTVGASASYVGENTDITKTQLKGGQIVMSAKKLAALVPISNDLLSIDVADTADALVRNDLVRSLATREDQAFLRDDGTQNTPKGLRYWAKTTIASTGAGASQIESDLVALIQTLEGADIAMSNPVWIMSPRSKNSLMKLRDGNGNLIYPEIRMANPTLYTFPVLVTNNVPTNLGAGSNESEVYLVDMDEVLLGETGGLEITADSSASYLDGGTLVSAFSQDQTVIRAIMRHDLAVRYDEAVAVLTGVTW